MPSRPRRLARFAVLLAALALTAAGVVGGCGSPRDPAAPGRGSTGRTAAPPAGRPAEPVRVVARRRVLSWVDTSREVRLADGTVALRRLTTVIRYPKVLGGTAADRARRFPLVVFAHGYDLTPGSYRTLLAAWARAGYVVAAPVLPGESAIAPGGPNRADLPNEPADLRFVIDRLVGDSGLAPLIDGSRIAVAGHSDGGSAALAVAYDERYRDGRVGAAVVLAGADLPGIAPFAFPADGPPLLAVQGDADTVNPPSATTAFYARATVPRFLLTLRGGGHYEPYTGPGAQLAVVRRVTTAFLDRTLRDATVSAEDLARLASRGGTATLTQG